jgi:hypothetical protein
VKAKFFHALAVSAIACATAGSVQVGASVVGPGGSAQFTDISGFTVPPGTVLADSTRDFSVTFNVDPGGTFIQTADGTLHGQVLRRDDGMLTFVYDFSLPRGGGTFGEEFGSKATVASFDNFTTDVSGRFVNPGFPDISRSSDGNVITFGGQGQGEDGSPLIVIATNATKFDSRGHASLTAVDEFSVPETSGLVVGKGSADLSGTLEPIHENGPTPIPLPPAVYGGIAMFAGVVVSRMRRVK